MDSYTIDLTARGVTYFVAVAILINLLDDLFIDISYFARGFHRRAKRRLTREELLAPRQQRIAIMVPAWKEAEVIAEMLEHNLATIDYDRNRYVIFCGTYQNDPGTQACVDAVARRYPSIRKVVVPHDGPTSKADCLNWVYQGIKLEEERSSERFDILLMHDAEDIVHPLSLRLYNNLIPQHDFVQTPVFSLELKPTQIVAGTYIDEFSEHHLKDMLVREAIGGLVPSAGVGSAFAREAFEDVACAYNQKPFNVESLTEDYEIAIKFRLAGKRVHFACRTLERAAEPHELSPTREEYLATREYFPSGFSASVRQRSRWVCGITLQTWRLVGWKGSLPVLYCLWRDRKAVFTNVIVLVAYALVVYLGGASLLSSFTDAQWSMQSVIPEGSVLSWLVVLNGAALVWRASLKAMFVARLYGPLQALLSAPRLVVGNLISVLATLRALRQYAGHLWTGEPLRWVKTTHEFPSVNALKARSRLLGEYLVANGLIDEAGLQRALELQRQSRVPLGSMLTTLGLCSGSSVASALSEQWGIDFAGAINAGDISLDVLRCIDEQQAERLNILPLSRDAAALTVGVARLLSPAEVSEVEQLCSLPIRQSLVEEGVLQHARALAYRRLVAHEQAPRAATQPPRIGEALLASRQLQHAELQSALEEQTNTGELLGELLQRKGLVTREAVAQVFRAWADAGDGVTIEGDPQKLARLGYALCALYSFVPLLDNARESHAVAAAFPLPNTVLMRVQTLMGAPVDVVYAPLFTIRTALSLAQRSLHRGHGADLVPPPPAIDACELSEIGRSLVWGASLRELWEQCLESALSPIDFLESRGRLSATLAAGLRARTYRLNAASTSASEPTSQSLLPPGLMQREGITVISIADQACVLATARPSPGLARRVARWLPTWAIEWQVRRETTEPLQEDSSWKNQRLLN